MPAHTSAHIIAHTVFSMFCWMWLVLRESFMLAGWFCITFALCVCGDVGVRVCVSFVCMFSIPNSYGVEGGRGRPAYATRYACLNLRLDHIDVQLVVHVREVFGLAETQAGNVDVLCTSKRTNINITSYTQHYTTLTSAVAEGAAAEPSRWLYSWLSTSRRRLVLFLFGCSRIAWKFTGRPYLWVPDNEMDTDFVKMSIYKTQF